MADSTWAVVAGSAITGGAAILASAIVPWVREGVASIMTRKREQRTAIRDAIYQALDVASRAVVIGATQSPVSEAALELRIEEARAMWKLDGLLNHVDSEIVNVLSIGYALIVKDVDNGPAVIGAMNEALSAWRRNLASAAQAMDVFQGSLALSDEDLETAAKEGRKLATPLRDE